MRGIETPTSLSSRGLRPVEELGAKREHGDRLRYMAGCRCEDCRRANSTYESDRQKARAVGEWNGIVSAEKARNHLLQLSEKGIGRRAVQAASDVAKTVLADIKSGKKLQIRAATERAILAVTEAAASDHALIPGQATWAKLDELLSDGYTKRELGRYLNPKANTLQLKRDFVIVRNAYLVDLMYQDLKFVPAKATARRLQQLRDEGFTQIKIEQRLAALAHETGTPSPSLEIRNGRIRAKTAVLMDRLYQQLIA